MDHKELTNDMTIFVNMFKRQFANILPVNFRHELMIKISKHIDTKISSFVDLMIFENKDSSSTMEAKEKVKEIFTGRFWFSNMAYFNELKRYFKSSIVYMSDDVVE